MPRLIPSSITNSVASLLIPQDIKERVTGFFLEVTEPLNVKDVSRIIELDLSVWRNILTEPIRAQWRAEVEEYGKWAKLVNASLVLGWIGNVRADLLPTLNTTEGKLWFYRQWAEITREIGI